MGEISNPVNIDIFVVAAVIEMPDENFYRAVEWCRKNCRSLWGIRGIRPNNIDIVREFHFEDANEAMFFKLANC